MTRLKTIFLPVLLFAMACTGDSIGKPSQNGPDGPGSGGTALPEGTVSITDFRAAVAGGDWHKAFTEAFRVADRILVPDGEYPLSPLMVPSGKTIEGAGAGTVFTPLGSILFRVEGSGRRRNPGREPHSRFLLGDRSGFGPGIRSGRSGHSEITA